MILTIAGKTKEINNAFRNGSFGWTFIMYNRRIYSLQI